MRNNFELLVIKSLLLIAFLIPAHFSFSQESDSIKHTAQFNGAVTVTTKGLSTFPNLTLGKPAAILDLSMGGDKFRFEPTLRFSLEGKPWTFILWFRYEMFKNERFQFKLGAHPAYSFKTITVNESGNIKEILRTQQFLAGEIAPVFFVAKNISIGPYYIYARGLDKDAVQNSNFISLRANFSIINLTDKYFMKLMAQAYYLKLDANDGSYVNSTLAFARRNFPFSISSTINKTIHSEIVSSDFLWNINLTYSFNSRYSKL